MAFLYSPLQRLCGTLLLLLLSGALPLGAQSISSTPLSVSSTTLAEGAANVPLTSTFGFTFDRRLPFSSVNNPPFRFEPRRLLAREKFFFGGENTVDFTIRHQAETDYVMYAFGALTCDPDNARATGCFTEPPGGVLATRVYLQNRPFVRNYTTAATAGTLPASGTVAFGNVSQPPAKAGGRAASLRALIDEAFSDESTVQEALAFNCTTPTDLRSTIVLLLDQYTYSESAWTPRAGAAPDAAGAFQMAHVRSGTYWPVAVHFADRCGKTVARYGYYDANGDFEPDPVQISMGGVSNLKLVLMPQEPILAREALAVANKRASVRFTDAELQTVTALNPAADGRAVAWRYEFYSPSRDTVLSIDAGSFNTQAFAYKARSDARDRLPLPNAFVNSDAILQRAESDEGASFRALFPNSAVFVSAELGDLSLAVRPRKPSVFWHVLYEAPPGSEPDTSLSLFYHAETGARLEGVNVGREVAETPLPATLSLPSPHPMRDWSTVQYRVSNGGPVTVALFDVLGREVRQLVDATVAPGTHSFLLDATGLPSGTYFVRLHAGHTTTQQAVVVLR